jgi:hypothetical protein
LIALKGLARAADLFATVTEDAARSAADELAALGLPTTASGAAAVAMLFAGLDLPAEAQVLAISQRGRRGLARVERLQAGMSAQRLALLLTAPAEVFYGKMAQYLGFMLGSHDSSIRPSSLSSQWRKMLQAVRRTRRRAEAAIERVVQRELTTIGCGGSPTGPAQRHCLSKKRCRKHERPVG